MGRRNAGLIDEVRDHNADDISSIVLPLLNVSRKQKNGLENESEPKQVQLWMSSASDKNTYCYDKAIELLELSILNADKAQIFGVDYRVPMKAGLIDKNFINELKLSPTFNESDFAKEYMSRFTGTSEESWFDFDKLASHRVLVNPETHENLRENTDAYYIFSVDIARLNCQTVCTVLKVFPRPNGSYCKLVNLFVLGKTLSEKVFDRQVLELKRLMALYNPRMTVIDINGIGISFGDLMIKETFDPDTGQFLPAYGFTNNKDYLARQPRNAIMALYGIKANAQINSDMHSTLYSKIYSGQLDFLISEVEAKKKLIATVKGQRMSPEERIKRLMPHDLTSKLIAEILNLKLKPTGVANQIAVEQINKRMTKDKFSALEMGVYYVNLVDQETMRKNRNRGLNRNLTFVSKGGGINGRSTRFY